MSVFGGRNINSLSLSTSGEKTCVDIPTDFGFFLGTRRQTKYLLSPLPPACSTQQPRERERERDRKKERELHF